MTTHWQCPLNGCPGTQVTEHTDEAPICRAANEAHLPDGIRPRQHVPSGSDYYEVPMVPQDLDSIDWVCTMCWATQTTENNGETPICNEKNKQHQRPGMYPGKGTNSARDYQPRRMLPVDHPKVEQLRHRRRGGERR